MVFWGGDLRSVQDNLDYLQNLGIDVVYLNPIFFSLTNHKYDAWDYHTVDPVYGDRFELRSLADRPHQPGMRLVLNHMGPKSPHFQEAQKNSQSPWRDFLECINVEVPAHQAVILAPDVSTYPKGYNRYDRLP